VGGQQQQQQYWLLLLLLHGVRWALLLCWLEVCLQQLVLVLLRLLLLVLVLVLLQQRKCWGRGDCCWEPTGASLQMQEGRQLPNILRSGMKACSSTKIHNTQR
jgi:hypothetical protein